MSRYTDEQMGRILLGLFIFGAVVLANAVFFLATRPDDAWVATQAEKQAEKAAQEVLQRMMKQPADK